MMSFRRGEGATTGPHARLSYRDDLGAWEPPIDIDLGGPGETDPIVVLSSLGVYRTRQWKIDFTGTESFSLVRAIEEFEVLEV